MGRVLVVDGDAVRRVALAAALGSELHEVESAATAETGASLARRSQPELLIAESTDVATAVRRDAAIARALILVIGASGEEAARVAAFEAGADDYVVRPYSEREVVLRVRALLRRARVQRPPDTVSLGGVSIHRGTRRVTSDGAVVPLTRREFDLLVRLVDGRGRVLARETLVADVWREETPSDRVVDTTLKRLRKKLPSVGRRIRTIRGVGYELMDGGDVG